MPFLLGKVGEDYVLELNTKLMKCCIKWVKRKLQCAFSFFSFSWGHDSFSIRRLHCSLFRDLIFVILFLSTVCLNWKSLSQRFTEICLDYLNFLFSSSQKHSCFEFLLNYASMSLFFPVNSVWPGNTVLWNHKWS